MTKKQLFVPPIPTDNEIHTTTKGIVSDLYMVFCYFIMVIGKQDKSMKFSCNSVYLFNWYTSVALIFCQGEDFKCFQMSFFISCSQKWSSIKRKSYTFFFSSPFDMDRIIANIFVNIYLKCDFSAV